MAKPFVRLVLISAVVTLSGCQAIGLTPQSGGGAPSEAVVPASAVEALVAEGHKAILANDLERATGHFNAALKLDITNPDLNYLNAYTYQLMAAAGDATKLELAEQGFNLALKFDPGHLPSRYQLGLLHMDQRRFELAQAEFASTALHRPNSPEILYNLAVASYYARDPRTAEAALNRLAQVAPAAAAAPRVLKAQAITKAALYDIEGARPFVKAYADAALGQDEVLSLDQRIASWTAFYEHDAELLRAQYDNPYGASSSGSNPYGGNPYSGGGANPYGGAQAPGGTGGTLPSFGTGMAAMSSASGPPPMVVVDVVLIGTQEDARESRGINLLNGLQLQFGDPLTGTPGFGYETNSVKDKRLSGLAENTRTITRSINIPAVAYSLNIANSADANNEILAKPSLVAQSGQTSEFFSGTEILAAAVSGGDGDSVSVQKEVGVKLAVTPEALDDDMIRLHVVAERTFLTDPASSVVFEFRLDTTKTNVNATVTMRYGETLILGGLSERETSRSADGVPGLMDIPGLNLFFSEKTERHFERSILILMTPRRPQYTRQAESDREQVKEQMSGLELDLERLAKRHKDWYTPRPTFNQIIEGLQGREFFEEFRLGDLEILPWRDSRSSRKEASAVSRRFLKN
ncbi:MAG: hypothetical protein RIB80_12990 [Rhodospirillales bacterium]